MSQALRVFFVGAAEAATVAALARHLPLAVLVVCGWVAACTLLVSAAIATGKVGLLAKRRDGRIPRWSLALFWPWHLAVRTIARLVRHNTAPFTEVLPGWWVGGWPHRHRDDAPWQAILDMTCELPRRQRDLAYLNLPTWDATAPTPDALEIGAAWLVEQRRLGRPVLVHCAAGRGRSVTVLCAALVIDGRYESPQSALAHVEGARPFARLQPSQRALLARWHAGRPRQDTHPSSPHDAAPAKPSSPQGP